MIYYLIVPVLLMAWRGYSAGALAVLIRALVFAGAYVMAWLAAPLLAPVLVSRGLLGMAALALPVAGVVTFVAASVLLNVVAWLLRRQIPAAALTAARPVGAVLGGGVGLLFGLLTVWFVGVVGDTLHMRAVASAGENAPAPSHLIPGLPAPVVSTQPASSLDIKLRTVSSDMMGAAGRAVLGDNPAAPLVGEVMRSPLSAAEGLRKLTAKPELQVLFAKPENMAVLASGNVAAVRQLPAFRQLVADGELMDFLATVGLHGDTDDARAQSLAENLSLCARNIERVRSSDEFRAIVSDPDLQAQMQRRDLISLLGNPKVRRLVDMLASSNPHPETTALPAEPPTVPAGNTAHDRKVAERLEELVQQSNTPAEKRRVYKWKDADGRQHYGYDKPPAGVQAQVIEQ